MIAKAVLRLSGYSAMISLTQSEAKGAPPQMGLTEIDDSGIRLKKFFFRLGTFIVSSFVFVMLSRLALIGLLSATIFSSPDGQWTTLSSFFILGAVILLAPLAGRLIGRHSAGIQLLPAYIYQAGTFALISLSLPFFPLSRWSAGLMCAFAIIGFETFWMLSTTTVVAMGERTKWHSVNALRFLTNLSATLLALTCFNDLPLTLTQLLRYASLLLIVGAIPFVLPVWTNQQNKTVLPLAQNISVDERKSMVKAKAAMTGIRPRLASRAVTSSLVWFAVALSCSLPVFSLFLFAIDVDSPVSATVTDYCKQLSWGGLLGVAVALIPINRRLRVSLIAIPIAMTTAGCFMCFVEPSGLSASIALLLLGATAAFSYIQLDTRMQRLFRTEKLGTIIGWRWAVSSACFLLMAVILKPQLDTISATMLLRLLSSWSIVFTTLILSTALALKVFLESGVGVKPISVKQST